MNRGLPVPAEVLLCAATLAALLGISYLSAQVHRFMSRRFPKSPVAAPAVAAEARPRDATVYIEGPLIMSRPDRPFERAEEAQ